MRVLIIAKTSFHVEELKGMSKEKFIEMYSGHGFDVNEGYQIIQEELKRLKDVREPKKKGK